jgi:hypothetical protein
MIEIFLVQKFFALFLDFGQGNIQTLLQTISTEFKYYYKLTKLGDAKHFHF